MANVLMRPSLALFPEREHGRSGQPHDDRRGWLPRCNRDVTAVPAQPVYCHDMGSAVRRTWWPVLGSRLVLPGVLPVVLAAVLATAGCTDTTRPRVDPLPPQPPAVTGPPQEPATSTGPVRPDPNFAQPDTAAGAALLATFPEPSELGAGWAYATGNVGRARGQERDINEVVDGSVPHDCLRLNPMPLPLSAAEVRYTFEGTPVIAFQVGFDNPAVSRAFLSLLVSNLEDCEAEKGDDGEDLVGQVVSLGEGIVLSNRFPADADARRTELAVLTAHSVVLLGSPVALGAEPLTSARSVAIAETFRQGGG